MVKRAMTLGSTLLWIAALCPLLAWSQQPAATETDKPAERDPRGPSLDGNYWFEVEVTIFSSAYGDARYSEAPVADNNAPRYPGLLRRLQNQSDSYQYPFGADQSQPPFAATTAAFGEGPLYLPADPAAFKILDHERDPFLALDRRYWRFNQLNSRLQSTGDHKVLWHQVWRQPLKPRGQSAALQVEGGESFGEHFQLEGSVRLSGANDLAAIDANLWLSHFSRDADSIWHLSQTRELGPNALYYLDHPSLGLLIEMRPYLVPEQRVPGTTTTPAKPAKKRGFE